jgi:hypothetical protein
VRRHVRIRDQVVGANHPEDTVQYLTDQQLHASAFEKEENRTRKKGPTLDFASGCHITSNESQAKPKRLKEEREAK